MAMFGGTSEGRGIRRFEFGPLKVRRNSGISTAVLSRASPTLLLLTPLLFAQYSSAQRPALSGGCANSTPRAPFIGTWTRARAMSVAES